MVQENSRKISSDEHQAGTAHRGAWTRDSGLRREGTRPVRGHKGWGVEAPWEWKTQGPQGGADTLRRTAAGGS